jgi:hypothetical protein
VVNNAAVARTLRWDRLGVSVAVAIGLAMIVFGFSYGRTDDGTIALPVGLENISPRPSARVQRQTEIVADLEPGYDGLIVINGIEVPPDQFSFDLGQYVIVFPCRLTDAANASVGNNSSATSVPVTTTSPVEAGGTGGTVLQPSSVVRAPQPPCVRATPGAELLKVEPGNVTVTVVFWNLVQGRANSQKSYTWSFTTY